MFLQIAKELDHWNQVVKNYEIYICDDKSKNNVLKTVLKTR